MIAFNYFFNAYTCMNNIFYKAKKAFVRVILVYLRTSGDTICKRKYKELRARRRDSTESKERERRTPCRKYAACGCDEEVIFELFDVSFKCVGGGGTGG